MPEPALMDVSALLCDANGVVCSAKMRNGDEETCSLVGTNKLALRSARFRLVRYFTAGPLNECGG